MTHDDIYAELTQVFRDVFDDDDITLTGATTAEDVPGWDSQAKRRSGLTWMVIWACMEASGFSGPIVRQATRLRAGGTVFRNVFWNVPETASLDRAREGWALLSCSSHVGAAEVIGR